MADNQEEKDTTREDGMSFWQHLAELRNTLLRVFVVVGALFIVFFIFMPDIFDKVILAPCSPSFPTYRLFDHISGDGVFIPNLSASSKSIELININLGTQLMTQMSSSFYLALTAGFPVVIYLLWLFVRPALYPKERRGATRAFIFGNVMFYIGMTVAYFLVFPLILRFLSDYQLSERISNTITLDSYMDTFYLIVMAFGIVFELPLLIWLLGRLGIVTRRFFSRFRRHAIVVLLILAALITPTGDPFTLLIVFAPLYGLWEFSALLVPKPEPEYAATINDTNASEADNTSESES